MPTPFSRAATAAACLALVIQPLNAAALPAPHRGLQRPNTAFTEVLYSSKIDDKTTVDVLSNGFARVSDAKNKTLRYVPVPHGMLGDFKQPGSDDVRAEVQRTLQTAQTSAYVPNRVVVVFRTGTTITSDDVKIPTTTIKALRANKASAPQYSTDSRVNALFAKLGVDRTERIGHQLSRSRLSVMSSMAASRSSAPMLDVSNAFRIHVASSSALSAVKQIAALPQVAYASLDWRVGTMNVGQQRIPATVAQAANARASDTAVRGRVTKSSTSLTPDFLRNYATASSLQPFLNAPGIDAVAAYDEVQRTFGQLPGAGEIVTNVSLGDLDDASARIAANDPCAPYVRYYGATTRVVNGQRYIDLPSMPMIPTYTASASGTLDPTGEVCGIDPALDEIGMDFSVMAPLPHGAQRPEEPGGGFTDLLGVAPGAQYRLVVPASMQPSTSDILGAFLGAASQTPAPNVITASIGFGTDSMGFYGRYLEDDLLAQSLIRTLVNSLNIVVCISAGDGLRLNTNAAVNPSGGSSPTNLALTAAQQTSFADLVYSTAPSFDLDSGAIDVGGTTLNDISAANPSDPAFAALFDNGTFAQTRWTGFNAWSSGFGSRVNISAPSDNIVTMSHKASRSSTTYDTVNVGLNGGTSASAPEVAAAAAVALQVARLTGHPFANATAVRDLLVQTATPVAQVPQADQPLNVGPQLNLRRAVERLMAAGGSPVQPAVARVAIMQRRSGNMTVLGASQNTVFVENTDPGMIDLRGPFDGNGNATDIDARSLITIAPDWEGLPAGATFRLFVGKNPDNVLSNGSYARLYPQQILAAAGMPLASTAPARTVRLTYAAVSGYHTIVQSTFDLTFGPADATSEYVSAPRVPATVSGATIPVTYDFSSFPAALAQNPTLIVSYPGRTNPFTGPRYFPAFVQQLTATTGTVNVPVSALQGAGIYGVGIWLNAGSSRAQPLYSDFAYVRVSAGEARASAPLLSAVASTQAPGHFLEIPYGSSFRVSYDVSNVPGATGAELEISAPGPTIWNNANAFNNPNGSALDANGLDSGSVATVPLYGRSGTAVIKAADAKLAAAMLHTVRVIPLMGGSPVGEASDVSAITMDGILAADGGGFQNGYAIDPSGSDALYTSTQTMSDGSNLNSVGTFDQNSGSSSTLFSLRGSDTLGMPGVGMFGGDTGFFEDAFPGTSNPPQFYTVPNVAKAQPWSIQGWQPPALATADAQIVQAGRNARTPVGAFLVDNGQAQPPSNRFAAFAVDVTGYDTPAPVNLGAPLASFWQPVARAFDYNALTNVAYLAAEDQYGDCSSTPTMLVGVDFGTQNVTASTAAGMGYTIDLSIDPDANVAAMTSGCYGRGQLASQLDIVNLATGTSTAATLGRNPGTLVANDPANKLFLVQQPLPDDLLVNNNALSAVVVTDENGNRVKTIEQFNFMLTEVGNHFFQTNAAARKAFAFGPTLSPFAPFYNQIVPFSY